MNDAIDSKEVSLFIVKNVAAKIHVYNKSIISTSCADLVFFFGGGWGTKE